MEDTIGNRAPACLLDRFGWRSRGYVPHFDEGQLCQSITFRVEGSLPLNVLEQWTNELKMVLPQKAQEERRRRIEDYLDKGCGESWLAYPLIGEIVEQAILRFDGDRYRLHAGVVMPNHVHVLITPKSGITLARILHSWKSFTAKRANKVLGRTGSFWQQEYFDRFIRHQSHFDATVIYIENNPVQAGLCSSPSDWRFSSAWERRHLACP